MSKHKFGMQMNLAFIVMNALLLFIGIPLIHIIFMCYHAYLAYYHYRCI